MLGLQNRNNLQCRTGGEFVKHELEKESRVRRDSDYHFVKEGGGQGSGRRMLEDAENAT